MASITPVKPHEPSRFANVRTAPDDPRFYAGRVNVRMLLQTAYGIEDAQIVGGPAWIRTEQFDIEAKAPDSVAGEMRKMSPAQARLVKKHMLRALLAGRFSLKAHHETRVLPVYLLVIAKHGPKLVAVNAAGGTANAGRGTKKEKVRWVRPRPGETAFFSWSATLPSIAASLSGALGRPVLDDTGLKGRYRYELHFMPGPGECGPFGCVGASGGGIMGEKPGEPGASARTGPSVFTALEQQLGLELKRGKAPVQVLVIDHIEQPSPN